jgi:hypothetical protein
MTMGERPPRLSAPLPGTYQARHSTRQFSGPHHTPPGRSLVGQQPPFKTASVERLREAYLLALARLEDESRRRIQAQYGRKPFGPPTPDAATPETVPPRLLIERGTPIFDLVRESGLYDEIEHAKDAALATHLQRLAGAVGDGTVARLTQLVQTTVAPAITRGVLRRPSPAVAPPSAPPGASDPGSGDPQ